MQGKNIQAEFSKEGYSLEDLLKKVEDYKLRLEKNQFDGYSSSSYKTSKMLINYWNRFILPYHFPNSAKS